ncbi:hypothetical protein ESCO_005511 [Escovopsis weberi]|uniref:Uncharacterized protein n=1 Tax=Escovopsis weberi TaxID=150374 RepID=A0A0M8MW77_ESCWE|nr:hypothetical protein ESCO_005511 [Escovopsis weberi]
MFSSTSATFNQPDSTILTLAKLIYHCIHCLIYRPFLPISLVELAGNGHQQSWQIEATNMCFFHANAITELIEAAKNTGTVEMPPFVGYSLCTAGTAHIHGAYYGKQDGNAEMNIFDSSADFLAREMQMLSELQHTWGIMQKQREMLQRLYEAHGELVSRTMSGNMMRFAPGFQLEDFFDRYSNIGGPGGLSFHFDSANLSLVSEMTDYSNSDSMPAGEMQIPTPRSDQPARPSLKRKNTSQSPHQHLLEMKPHGNHGPSHSIAVTNAAYYPPRSSVPMQQPSMVQHSQTHSTSPSMHAGPLEHAHVSHHPLNMRTPDITPPGHSAIAHYGITHSPQSTPGGMGSMGGNSFGPAYSYHTVTTPNGAGPPVINDASGGYDAMFGGMPTNAYGSPAGWANDGYRMMGHATPGAAAPSPSTRSNCGSTGTVGDEKDPFMSLLEQLANDESRQHDGLKNELDFYLTGPHGRP